MIYHIIPVDDEAKHEESISCWCKPSVISKRDLDIVVHNSFDGREDFEDQTYRQ